MRRVVITGAARTAVGTFGGTLSAISAVDLGAVAIREALKRSRVEPGMVDEVLLGNVLQAGQGMNVARQASLKAGLPVEVPCTTVNYVCGSGLKSVIQATQVIAGGDADVVVAGGTENMDLAPYLISRARYGYRMGHGELTDCMIKDGLWCAFTDTHMGMTAEIVAERWGITREMQDEYAARSQNRAEAAIKSGRFKDEIVPVEIPQKKGPPVLFEQDEHPRFETTTEKLSQLRPAFKKDGTVTAGNASGINDGAAALVLMAEDRASKLGLEPLASIVAYALAGVSPEIMGVGPVPATHKALARAGLRLEDIDLMEINEAFAATSLAVMKDLACDPERVNVNGGAIALGHPIGASGARILVTLLYEMAKRGCRKGLASLCVGGGMGITLIVER